MSSPPSPPSSTALTNAITGYTNAITDQSNDELALNGPGGAIAQMMADVKAGNVGEAFAMAMTIMLDAMHVRSDSIRVLAKQLDIGSACANLVTQITTNLNYVENNAVPGSALTPGPSSNQHTAATNVEDAFSILQSNLSPLPSWIDGGTASAVLGAISNIATAGDEYVGWAPSTPGSEHVLSWALNSAALNPSGKGPWGGSSTTGQQLIQSINGDVGTMNNAFNGYSQGLSNSVQFTSQQISQILNASTSVIQSYVNMCKGIVQNVGSSK